MVDKRLLYKVILKLLALAGIIALLLVFLNATFFTNIEMEEVKIDAADTVVSLSDVETNGHTVVRWNNRRIGVYKRANAIQLKLVGARSDAPQASQEAVDMHAWRSIDPRYFVYVDVGDSGHCPLFWQTRDNEFPFKDTCTGNWFDTQGRYQSDGTLGLKIPPHHYTKNNQLVIGRWQAE